MSKQIYNFCAALPCCRLKSWSAPSANFVIPGLGASVMELSHRGKPYGGRREG